MKLATNQKREEDQRRQLLQSTEMTPPHPHVAAVEVSPQLTPSVNTEFIAEDVQPVIISVKKRDAVQGVEPEVHTTWYAWKYEHFLKRWPEGRVQRGDGYGADCRKVAGPYSTRAELRTMVGHLKGQGAVFRIDPDDAGGYLSQ